MTTRANAAGDIVIAATPAKGGGSFKADIEAWRKVTPQKRKDQRKIKPKVIITAKRGERSYAGILRRKKKQTPSLTNLIENVNCIRWSHKGDLMLKLNKSKDVTAKKGSSKSLWG